MHKRGSVFFWLSFFFLRICLHIDLNRISYQQQLLSRTRGSVCVVELLCDHRVKVSHDPYKALHAECTVLSCAVYSHTVGAPIQRSYYLKECIYSSSSPNSFSIISSMNERPSWNSVLPFSVIA